MMSGGIVGWERNVAMMVGYTVNEGRMFSGVSGCHLLLSKNLSQCVAMAALPSTGTAICCKMWNSVVRVTAIIVQSTVLEKLGNTQSGGGLASAGPDG